jgi:hypothetical protein
LKVNITAWYLNSERVSQLIGSQRLLSIAQVLKGFSGRASLMSKEDITKTALKEEVENWLHNNSVPSLGECIAKKIKLKQGDLFTIFQNFYGKGLAKYSHFSENNLPNDAVAELHNKTQVDKNIRIRFLYSPKNIISSTAWSRLSGYTRLFVFGYIEKINSQEIIARPYVIGDLHTGFPSTSRNIWQSNNYGEIHPSQIDQFSSISEVYKTEKSAPDLKQLRNIPEEKVKTYFAEIIHECHIPKDWGGEKSDLFSSNVSIEGKFLSTAFLFKGPAKFKPMTLSELGKNGDQIDRLFTEPANLLILQHCHKVTTSVRNTMRAFACRIHDLRYFSIIDGHDTLRILQAYNKGNSKNV